MGQLLYDHPLGWWVLGSHLGTISNILWIIKGPIQLAGGYKVQFLVLAPIYCGFVKAQPNGIVGTGFASWYQLQYIVGF